MNWIWAGNDPTLGVDSIGTIPSALATYAAVLALQPYLIINAGTAGGFKVATILSQAIVLELLIFDLYGIGLRKVFETPNLVKELNLKEFIVFVQNLNVKQYLCIFLVAKLSTGGSLDMTEQDESSIIANDATVIDMEGAAIAYVADILKVPAIFIKAVNSIVDGDKAIVEEFLQNLEALTAVLDLNKLLILLMESAYLNFDNSISPYPLVEEYISTGRTANAFT
ncbi:5'-methylthioadenosine/S-adenosylhomocysteine nucleosidase 1-like [Glycine soja]|uniref:5'-methylthioadenosine/S-adenosylhomocysteine nucleosidase 1-like n=1 Tax=Glycine soja TaxID=3848 RepID=UPI00071944D3|nr:5'-methylthioadenosine/S-adenosylhomocysteine nucleosidase 1-like [Glycine soja]